MALMPMLIAFIIVMTSGAVAAQGNTSSKQPSPTFSPRADVLCDKEEAKCLKQLVSMAKREGNKLRLTLANGQTKTFTTTQAACKANLYERDIFLGIASSLSTSASSITAALLIS